jgi:hypothetical protein
MGKIKMNKKTENLSFKNLQFPLDLNFDATITSVIGKILSFASSQVPHSNLEIRVNTMCTPCALDVLCLSKIKLNLFKG